MRSLLRSLVPFVTVNGQFDYLALTALEGSVSRRARRCVVLLQMHYDKLSMDLLDPLTHLEVAGCTLLCTALQGVHPLPQECRSFFKSSDHFGRLDSYNH